MTADERRDAEDYIAAKLGTDPTPAELMEFCVRSHAKRRRLERGLDTFDRWFRIVCKRGEAAQRQNVAYFEQDVGDMPISDATDHRYRLRHVREALRGYDLHLSDAQIKRLLKEARAQELIGELETNAQGKKLKMSLTREEFDAFVQWVVTSK